MGDPKNKPVVLLHGGQGNSNQMFNQANYLYAAGWYVIVQDTRGQGRSPYSGFTKFHYDDMARDIIAVLDHLEVPKAAFVGWSDGAITSLNVGMNYTARVDRIFAHGANAQWNMTIPTPAPTLPNRLRKRDDAYSYASLSPTPEKEQEMEDGVALMWNTEPTWGKEAFAKILAPTWIVDGDRDGSVSRNQPDAMAAWTPNAGELIIPNAGHAILLEDPGKPNYLFLFSSGILRLILFTILSALQYAHEPLLDARIRWQSACILKWQWGSTHTSIVFSPAGTRRNEIVET
ncbi:hypothetical protein P7C70_g6794, partial [Phenoliferia sp. Uapishka_3]